MEVWVELLKAAITGGLALLGVYLANRKSAALVEYRLEQLEKKVDIHNSVIARTYKLEESTAVQENDIKTLYKKIDKLEAKA